MSRVHISGRERELAPQQVVFARHILQPGNNLYTLKRALPGALLPLRAQVGWMRFRARQLRA